MTPEQIAGAWKMAMDSPSVIIWLTVRNRIVEDIDPLTSLVLYRSGGVGEVQVTVVKGR